MRISPKLRAKLATVYKNDETIDLCDRALLRKTALSIGGFGAAAKGVGNAFGVAADAGAAANSFSGGVAEGGTAAGYGINTAAGLTSAADAVHTGVQGANKAISNTMGFAADVGKFAPKVMKGISAAGEYAAPLAVASLGNEGYQYFKDPAAHNKETAEKLGDKGVLGRVGYGLMNPGESILSAAGNIGEAGHAMYENYQAGRNLANTQAKYGPGQSVQPNATPRPAAPAQPMAQPAQQNAMPQGSPAPTPSPTPAPSQAPMGGGSGPSSGGSSGFTQPTQTTKIGK